MLRQNEQDAENWVNERLNQDSVLNEICLLKIILIVIQFVFEEMWRVIV